MDPGLSMTTLQKNQLVNIFQKLLWIEQLITQRRILNSVLDYRDKQQKILENSNSCLTLGDVTTVNLTRVNVSFLYTLSYGIKQLYQLNLFQHHFKIFIFMFLFIYVFILILKKRIIMFLMRYIFNTKSTLLQTFSSFLPAYLKIN